jgi:hypothetical protein
MRLGRPSSESGHTRSKKHLTLTRNQAQLLSCPTNSLVTIPTQPMTEKSTGGLVHESMYCLYFTGWDPIWIKKDVCKQELIIAETYTPFNHKNTQTILLYKHFIYIFNQNCTIDVNTNVCLL